MPFAAHEASLSQQPNTTTYPASDETNPHLHFLEGWL
jgi:hypothetical protein